MSDYQISPMDTSPQWHGSDIPKLRMREEKQHELKLSTSPVVVVHQAEPFRRSLDPKLQRYGLILICVILSAVAAYAFVGRFVITSVLIPRDGMAAERHHLNRWRYLWGSPQRGDVVVVKDHAELSIKRIVARPSDYLNLKEGVVYLNGKKVEGLQVPPGRAEAGGLKGRLLQLGRAQFYVTGTGNADQGVVLRQNILGLVTD